MGRKRKDDNERRDIRVDIKFSKKECEMLDRLAVKFNVKRSALIRHLVADKYVESWPN